MSQEELRGVKRSQEDSGGLKTVQEKWKVKGSKGESRGIKRHDELRGVKRNQEESRGIKRSQKD